MKPKQILAVTRYNFRRWHKNPRIVITFCLAFVLCFLLSDKAVKFAKEYETTMQLVEAFVWTFGDSNSILLSSLLLLLFFADMPFISPATPFYLMRIDRKTWLMGQAAYIALATLIYLAFILISTSLVCMRQSFVGICGARPPQSSATPEPRAATAILAPHGSMSGWCFS